MVGFQGKAPSVVARAGQPIRSRVRLATRSAVIVLCAAILGPGAFGSLYGQDDATLVTEEQLLSGIGEWREKVASMHLAWRSHSADDVRSVLGHGVSDAVLKSYYNEGEFYWEDTGAMRLETRSHQAGKTSVDSWGWSPLDGEQFKAQYTVADGVEFLERLTIQRMVSSVAKSTVAVVPLHGWYKAPTGQWLDELVSLPTPRALEPGSSLLKVQLGGSEMLLDSSRNFLVTRISSEAAGGGTWTFTADEFQRVEPGLWMPLAGTTHIQYPQSSSVAHWRVTAVEINREIPSSLFLPPPPQEGTVVEDQIRGEVTRHGISDSARMSEIVDATHRGFESFESSWFVGRPPSWWRVRLIVAALVLAICLHLSVAISRKVFRT